MTARSLLNSLPTRNMKTAVGQNKKLMIVMCILQVLGIPVMMTAGIVGFWQESVTNREVWPDSPLIDIDIEMYIVLGAIFFGIAVILGMAAAISVFHELWKKSDVDMAYSLPLTGSQRFFSHYFAGSIVYLLPYIGAVLLGWIILLGGSFAIDFDHMGQTHMEFLGEACKYYLIASLGMFLLMWMYYTTTVLITACCGTLFESIYTSFLLNCLVPGTFAAVLAVICDEIYAFSFEYLWQPIGYMSPVGGLIYLIYQLFGSEIHYAGWGTIDATQATDHGMIPAFIRWALIIAVITAVALIAAWQLYKRRKAESVSKPFVFIGVYYLMLTALTVLILCLLVSDAIGPVLIFSAVIYFLMEVVRKRGFRKFWVSAITYVLTVALTLGMFAAVIKTDVFGTVYRIPAAASVSSVKVEIYDNDTGQDLYLEYTDKDVINAIREIHKDIADDMKQYGDTVTEINEKIEEMDFDVLLYGDYPINEDKYNPDGSYNYETLSYHQVDPEDVNPELYDLYAYDYEYDGNYEIESRKYRYAWSETVRLTYYTHTGSTVYRYYEVNADQYAKIMTVLYGTELYASAAADALVDNMKSKLGEYVNDKDKDFRLPNRVYMTMEYTGRNSAGQEIWINDGAEMVKKIRECYYNDLKNMKNGEQLTCGLYGTLYQVPIWNACTETIALLESYGFRPFMVSEKFDIADADRGFQGSGYPSNTMAVQIYAPGDYVSAAMDHKTAVAFDRSVYVRENGQSYEETYYCSADISVADAYPELHDLLAVAVDTYYSTEACYMLAVNGTWYAIPNEYAELAEAVIALPEGYADDKLAEIAHDYNSYAYPAA